MKISRRASPAFLACNQSHQATLINTLHRLGHTLSTNTSSEPPNYHISTLAFRLYFTCELQRKARKQRSLIADHAAARTIKQNKKHANETRNFNTPSGSFEVAYRTCIMLASHVAQQPDRHGHWWYRVCIAALPSLSGTAAALAHSSAAISTKTPEVP